MATRTPRNGPISDDLLDRLLAGRDPAEALRSGELIDDPKKAVAERALDAEMDVHPGGEEERATGNHRNGHNRKRVLTESGAMDLEVPRDRHGNFEPRLVERYARRLPGFDDKVISMYARGMTTRDAPHVIGRRSRRGARWTGSILEGSIFQESEPIRVARIGGDSVGAWLGPRWVWVRRWIGWPDRTDLRFCR